MAEQEVPKRAEEGLFYRLKQKAFEECRAQGTAYADCCRGRTLSMAWKCRDEMAATRKLEELKQRWVAAGKPAEPEWDALLKDL
ncbi:hypothetical protein QBZ16_001968 [Prototheca wickerhamii]|uniref:COX assembly mitochondrial protein n=1 Tax=Prototheca wickerhamii TaxID=3111 RepID=A0AAD9IL59_PROWI|nr:hypothetical protein QBZ16_001968 [Prototheca wickerhamii]